MGSSRSLARQNCRSGVTRTSSENRSAHHEDRKGSNVKRLSLHAKAVITRSACTRHSPGSQVRVFCYARATASRVFTQPGSTCVMQRAKPTVRFGVGSRPILGIVRFPPLTRRSHPRLVTEQSARSDGRTFIASRRQSLLAIAVALPASCQRAYAGAVKR